jgi:hypothetical protein
MKNGKTSRIQNSKISSKIYEKTVFKRFLMATILTSS